MSRVHSFAPVADKKARALILGSMPGEASLKAGQYYAHPRNAFWSIVCRVLGARGELSYEARLRLLKAHGLALWDVLGSCVRPGSSDSAIQKSSIRVNEFAAFFRAHPGIRYVFFNGAKAEECYRKYALPALPAGCAALEYRRLPSTSPAHAALSPAQKYKLWKTIIIP